MNDVVTREEEDRYAELQRIALDFARSGNTEELQKMLNAGLPVNLMDEKGNSLLMLAAYNGNLDTTQMLIDLGADVNRVNDRGQSPLAGVAFKGYVAISERLLRAGADIHADNGGGMKPVHFAMLFGRDEVRSLLEEYEAKDKNRPVGRTRLLPAIARLIGWVRKAFRLNRK
ncbi:ankyrin repeat domain-containing protein [Balneolaceae bacterium ANBcel3]|nr:ankyrin repeat domain-containing protein [Balneolaceae bacterium ANBcel3]